MTRNATTALAVCVVLLGTAIEARADCQYVRGSIAETRISLGTEPTRFLGNVTGVLNGAVTVTLLSLPPNVVRSLDIFVTKSGDVLRTEGLPTRTPVPGAPPGEFTVHVDLDITGGWGKYEGAYGTIEYDGLGHNGAVPPTADYVYKGTVCGPNIKSEHVEMTETWAGLLSSFDARLSKASRDVARSSVVVAKTTSSSPPPFSDVTGDWDGARTTRI